MNDPTTFPPGSSEPIQPAGRLERHFNWVNDQKWNWMPFLSLRPEPYEYVVRGVLMAFATFVFGPVSLLGGVFIFFVATQTLGLWLEVSIWLSILGFIASLTTGVTHQYVCFHFWNRRAFRLRSQPGFRPPTADTLAFASDTDSPYRPPESGAVPAAPDYLTPPLPLRHTFSLLEGSFVHGTLLALTVAPTSFWYAIGTRNWPDGWQYAVRLAPLLSGLILAAGIGIIESGLSVSLRWLALAVRTLVGFGLIATGILALVSSALLSSAAGTWTLSVCGILLGIMGCCTLVHCLIQSARLFRQTTSQQAGHSRVIQPAALSVPLMADGERP